jgi:hypothetical protein
MIRVAALVFAFAVPSIAQAMPLAPLPQSNDMTVTVSQGCGVGYQRVAGRCVRNTAVRAFRRCAVGYRLSGNRCIKRAP